MTIASLPADFVNATHLTVSHITVSHITVSHIAVSHITVSHITVSYIKVFNTTVFRVKGFISGVSYNCVSYNGFHIPVYDRYNGLKAFGPLNETPIFETKNSGQSPRGSRRRNNKQTHR